MSLAANPDGEARTRVEREILAAVREIRYGSVELVIHDGRVVQIERREKLRFDSPTEPGGPRRTAG